MAAEPNWSLQLQKISSDPEAYKFEEWSTKQETNMWSKLRAAAARGDFEAEVDLGYSDSRDLVKLPEFMEKKMTSRGLVVNGACEQTVPFLIIQWSSIS